VLYEKKNSVGYVKIVAEIPIKPFLTSDCHDLKILVFYGDITSNYRGTHESECPM
jgi:hypothetical protein